MTKILRAAALAAGLMAALPQVATATTVAADFEGLSCLPNCSLSDLNSAYRGMGLTFSSSMGTASVGIDPFFDPLKPPPNPPNHAINLFQGEVTVKTDFRFETFSFSFIDGVDVATNTIFNYHFANNGFADFTATGDLDTKSDPPNSVTFSGTTYLDKLVFSYESTTPPLPEPASIGLVALALGGAGFASRRRRS